MSYLGLGPEEGVADVAHPPGGVPLVTGAVDVDVGVVLKWDTECPGHRERPREPDLWEMGTAEGLNMGLGFGETTNQPMEYQWSTNQWPTNDQPINNQQ